MLALEQCKMKEKFGFQLDKYLPNSDSYLISRIYCHIIDGTMRCKLIMMLHNSTSSICHENMKIDTPVGYQFRQWKQFRWPIVYIFQCSQKTGIKYTTVQLSREKSQMTHLSAPQLISLELSDVRITEVTGAEWSSRVSTRSKFLKWLQIISDTNTNFEMGITEKELI